MLTIVGGKLGYVDVSRASPRRVVMLPIAPKRFSRPGSTARASDPRAWKVAPWNDAGIRRALAEPQALH
jgi:hypothetical protein